MATGTFAPPVMSDWRVQRFLEWLCTTHADREPSTQRELIEVLGISQQMAASWKKDADFLGAWEALYRKTVGAPERVHQVLNQLYDTATDRSDPRQVQAARAYLEAVDAARPKKVEGATSTRAAKELSNEQLLAILAERASQELSQRG